MSDTLFDSRERKLAQGRRETTSTAAILVVSILAGTALAITCSYRPIALWWVMVACSAINIVRFVAGRQNASVSLFPEGHASHALVAFVRRRFAATSPRWGGRPSATTSKSALDRQNTRFLIWFTQHNLAWTTVGFCGSLLLWHRFGPTTPALIVMSALMSCGVFAAIGATIGARSNGLGLCWREPCRTPDFRSVAGLVMDVGTVLVLRNRHEYAAARDWAKGGRYHELFLAIDELARAGVEPGLAATLHDDGEVARRKLANKERYDRALALSPVFVASLFCAFLVVPHLAGTEPLPSLWDIVTGNAAARSSSAEGDADGTPSGTIATSDRANSQARPQDTARQSPGDAAGGTASRAPAQAANDGASNQSAPQSRVSSGADNGGTGATENQPAGSRPGDLVNGLARGGAASGDGSASGGDGDASEANGSGQGAGERSAATDSSKDGQSGGPGGRGGGPNGHGTQGVAPQRASSPAALPDALPNPGKVIEVVLPPFSQAKGESTGDDPAGQKREGTPPAGQPAYQPQRDTTPLPNEPTSREPVQRWPNWVFRLLHK